MADLTKKLPDYSAIALLIAFSFCLTMGAGRRGLFAYDQSIVFDGGWRVLSGQIPYKDFLAPYGLMVFWIQALFFKVLGVSYFSYVITAAFLNALATACGMFLTRLIFPSRRNLTYICGLLTAIWFYPPFGTPYAEQTAFLFNLISITLLFAAHSVKEKMPATGKGLLFFCGVSAFLSLLCKQNAGIFILPLFLLLILALYRQGTAKALFCFAIFLFGFFVAALGIYFWVNLCSNNELFFKYFIYLPAFVGIARFSLEKVNFLTGLCDGAPLHILPLGIRFILGVSFLVSIAGIIFYAVNLKKKAVQNKTYPVLCILSVYLFFYQYIFIHSTMNQAENGIPFIGLIFCIGVGCLFDLTRRKITKTAVLAGVVFSTVYLSSTGLKTALTRKVQEFGSAEFSAFSVAQLRGLKWAHPTRIKRYGVTKEDMENLFLYLKAKNENFFIFPDFTIFYALAGRPSPQPLLWFHKGLTYLPAYDPFLDGWIVEGLKKNKVKAVILEEASLLDDRINDFPLLKAYIDDNFRLWDKIGIFNILELKR